MQKITLLVKTIHRGATRLFFKNSAGRCIFTARLNKTDSDKQFKEGIRGVHRQFYARPESQSERFEFEFENGVSEKRKKRDQIPERHMTIVKNIFTEPIFHAVPA